MTENNRLYKTVFLILTEVAIARTTTSSSTFWVEQADRDIDDITKTTFVESKLLSTQKVLAVDKDKERPRPCSHDP